MEWQLFLVLFVATLLTLLVLRVPVGFALLATSVGAVILMQGPSAGLRMTILGLTSSLTSFSLLPVPLFILMGELLLRSGIITQALTVLDRLLGRLPGRLAVLSALSGALLGVLSGSPMASTAMLAGSLVPQMTAAGYSKRLAMGSVLGSGGLSMIIPPSTLAVIWGATAGVPIGPLLMAGLFPGILMAVNYLVVIVGWSHWFRGAPRKEQAAGRESIARTLRDLLLYVLPLGLIVFLVLGMILLGVATTSESAALGVMGAFFLAVVYRRCTFTMLREALVSTATVVGMVLLIVSSATLYSQVMAGSGATRGVVGFVTGVDASPYLMIVIMLAMCVLLGLFVETIAIILVTLPFFMPVISALGFDPLWFGIIMLMSLQIGLTTPPYGMSLFVMKAYVPADTRLQDVYWAAVPFVLSDVIAIGIVMTLPILALWLPRVVMG